MDSSIFDLRHLTAKIKTFIRIVAEGFLTDECSPMAYDKNELQVILDMFSSVAKLFRLTASLKKTECLFHKAPDMAEIHPFPTIDIDDTTLQHVNSFKYPGRIISSNVPLDIEITERINEVSQALGKL